MKKLRPGHTVIASPGPTETVTLTDGLMVIIPGGVPSDARAEVLRAAWKRVEPATHWKAPVDAVLPATTTIAEIEDILEAIEFMTATSGAAEALADGRVRITAPGYWAGPAN